MTILACDLFTSVEVPKTKLVPQAELFPVHYMYLSVWDLCIKKTTYHMSQDHNVKVIKEEKVSADIKTNC